MLVEFKLKDSAAFVDSIIAYDNGFYDRKTIFAQKLNEWHDAVSGFVTKQDSDKPVKAGCRQIVGGDKMQEFLFVGCTGNWVHVDLNTETLTVGGRRYGVILPEKNEVSSWKYIKTCTPAISPWEHNGELEVARMLREKGVVPDNDHKENVTRLGHMLK